MGQSRIITTDGKGRILADTTLDVSDEQANADVLLARASAALANNAVFLALAAPTNSQIGGQVRVLTREVNALIRLLLGQTDTVDGT